MTLGLTDALPDGDGTLGNVTITGLAGDLSNFNGGTYTAGTGTWSGTAAQFNALTFTAGEDGSHALTIQATTTGAEAATTTTTAYTLTINPVAEGPTLTGTIGTANEGGTVTLGLTDALPDGDGTLGNVTITGLAGDLSNFNGGTYTAGTGTWSGTAAQFNALTFTAGEDGSHALTIQATTTGAEAATTTTTAYTLTINPVAEGPTLTGTIGTANEGGTVTLGLTDALPDGDGTLGNVTITGLAGDLSNFNGGTYTAGTGTWSGTAAQFNALTFTAGEDGSHALTIQATTTGAEAATTTTTAYTLTINPVAEGPTLTGTIGTANEGGTVTLGLTDALPDGDGTLGNVTITGLAGICRTSTAAPIRRARGRGAGRRRSSTR